MLQYRSGNLLDSEMQTLVNTVNCVGVMGKGIALQFKNAYPSMFRDYEARCRRGDVQPGIPYRFPEIAFSGQMPLGFDALDAIGDERVIVNFPTKDHWRGKSRIEYVERGLELLHENYQRWGIRAIAIPALGCGNGGLNWNEVGPLMKEYLDELAIPIEVYVPSGVDPAAPFPNHALTAVARS